MLGLPDFRQASDERSANIALAHEFVAGWDALSYEAMVRLRWSRLREQAAATAVSQGKRKPDFTHWNRDEESHLASYATRGKFHCAMLAGMAGRLGKKLPVPALLDIGCGWGRDLLHLAHLAERVIGVDVSCHSLLMSKKLLEENNIDNVDLVLAQGEHLPLRSQTVDGINASATIEHFPNPGDFLAEASRCLRPGGWLYLYYPNRYSVLPETHTGIYGLGWLSTERQKRIVARKQGAIWDVTLFSQKDFRNRLRRHFEVDRCLITALPAGLEEFAHTSKFARMLGPFFLPAKLIIKTARALPGLRHVLTSIAPVHFVAASKVDRPKSCNEAPSRESRPALE